MIDVRVERIAEFPAAVVWEEMRHFDRVLNWVPGGSESTIAVSGHGVGAIRDITLVTQGYVQHRLVSYSEENRTFSYELTAGMPIGMQEYIVVASVVPIDDLHCTILWQGQMTADGSLEEAAVGHALEIALGNMVTGLLSVLSNQDPSYVTQPNEGWQLNR